MPRPWTACFITLNRKLYVTVHAEPLCNASLELTLQAFRLTLRTSLEPLRDLFPASIQTRVPCIKDSSWRLCSPTASLSHNPPSFSASSHPDLAAFMFDPL